ncbi:hypothetical protein NPIL_326671 [Nephila pilipes]|uniref:Uncharacterized protein n=1 Tax=Nephila pilipes TaxID=299642 RepID=A0A8X6NS51_NEPPI|nr:hypothetical protein NPIL_326671 [Nephila pilipes]
MSRSVIYIICIFCMIPLIIMAKLRRRRDEGNCDSCKFPQPTNSREKRALRGIDIMRPIIAGGTRVKRFDYYPFLDMCKALWNPGYANPILKSVQFHRL